MQVPRHIVLSVDKTITTGGIIADRTPRLFGVEQEIGLQEFLPVEDISVHGSQHYGTKNITRGGVLDEIAAARTPLSTYYGSKQ